MDPLSAGLGAGASILGSLMNTSSAQAINNANLQAAQYVNLGQNLPQYYTNLGQGVLNESRTTGISPLALLGQRAPSVTAQLSPTEPGRGLQEAGRIFSQIDPAKRQADEMAQRLGQANIERIKAETSNTKVQTARDTMINDMLTQGGSILNKLNAGVDRLASDYKSATSVSWYDVYKYLFGSSSQSSVGSGVAPYLEGVGSALGR